MFALGSHVIGVADWIEVDITIRRLIAKKEAIIK